MCKMIIVTNVKWPFKIIQGHLFRGQWKANEGLNNNVGLNSKTSEYIDTESTERIIVIDHRVSFDASSPENLREY